MLEPEEDSPGIHILRMNVFSLMKAVGTDPTHFGFTDIIESSLRLCLGIQNRGPRLSSKVA